MKEEGGRWLRSEEKAGLSVDDLRTKKNVFSGCDLSTFDFRLARMKVSVVTALAAAVVLCAAAFSSRGASTELLEPMRGLAYPMNAEALGDSGLVTAKAQMAFGGMEALQRQVDEMNINWGNKPTHVRQNFADAYGKMNALKKLVSHMEAKDFDAANHRLADTPDEALQAVMRPSTEHEIQSPREIQDEQRAEGEQSEEDEMVRKSREAARAQRGRAGLHSLHMRGQRILRRPGPSNSDQAVIMPPFMRQQGTRAQARRRGMYDPALNLSGAERRRLAQRAAARVSAGAFQSGGEDAVVSPPWTR